MPERQSAMAPLAHRAFRAMWTANLASNFGGLIQSVGAAWLMTTLASSADMVALVQASTALPIMLFSLAAGAIADNFERRRVMLAAQGGMLVVSVLLTLFAWLGLLGPWGLLAFTFLIGCGIALNNPAWQASVGDMVPRSDLAAAVTLNSVGFNITRSVGPAIGGLVVAAAGPAAAFAINALSYIAPIAALARWQQPARENALPRETLGLAMTAGLRYVAMSPGIETVLVRSFAFGVTVIAVTALLPLLTLDHLAGGPLTYGLMLGCFGVGAIMGAFLSGRLREILSSEWIVRLAFVGFSACAAICALSGSAHLTGAAMVLGGACWVLALSLFNITVQLSTPRWVVGRALALYQTATFGGMALGAWLWGSVADGHGSTTALIVAAVLMLAGGAIGLRWPLPGLVMVDLDPLDRFREPQLALELQGRSGPIVITIEFDIAEEDTETFLNLMAERRRVRRRDGARHWTLSRDLERPTVWLESYHTPTWTEYVRHNQRLTQADADVGAGLRALHRGAEPPRVRRMIERPLNWPGTATGAPKPLDEPH